MIVRERSYGLGIEPVSMALLATSIASTAGSFLLQSQRAERKRQSTLVADEAERLMVENMRLFDAGERSRVDALAEFDYVWSQLVAGCQQVGGNPGQRCVSERARGGVYDYFARYRDPIEAAEENAAFMSSSAASWSGSSRGAATGGLSPLLLAAAAGVLVLMIGGDR